MDWELRAAWVTPGWLDRVLVVSALPAFLAGVAVVIGLSKLGVDEVLSFMVSMPILLVAWFYFLGWLLDRWSDRRQNAKHASMKMT
jgi:high-affinity Fe2+/Pb2+ permease